MDAYARLAGCAYSEELHATLVAYLGRLSIRNYKSCYFVRRLSPKIRVVKNLPRIFICMACNYNQTRAPAAAIAKPYSCSQYTGYKKLVRTLFPIAITILTGWISDGRNVDLHRVVYCAIGRFCSWTGGV